jgi:membrane protein
VTWTRTAVSLGRQTFADWSEDKAARLGAALAYYTAFSIAPLLVIAVAVAGLVFGEEAAYGQLRDELAGLLGPDGGAAVEEMIAGARRTSTGIVSLVIGGAMLLFGASGVFGQLQDALNTIWEVEPRPGRGVWGVLQDRFLSFAMVLGTGFLLLVSLVLSAATAALADAFAASSPALTAVGVALQTILSLAVTTALFAAIFKLLPDAEVRWRDVWVGAAVTAVLFAIGRALLGLYLGRGAFASSYGAAGSVLVVLLWVYYASQILFLGAEFTQVWANRFGARVRPAADAVPVPGTARADQGIPRRQST